LTRDGVGVAMENTFDLHLLSASGRRELFTQIDSVRRHMESSIWFCTRMYCPWGNTLTNTQLLKRKLILETELSRN